MDYTETLLRIRDNYMATLADNLTGIYVHGSIAFGCFNRSKSDIDFIVVVTEKPTQRQKEEMILVLLDLSRCAPQKGLEMSVVLREHCRNFIYPTPYELHFSNAHIDKARSDISAFCRTMNGTDKDLAAHFTVIKHVGIALCGVEIKDVFGDVPAADYLDSLNQDIENAENDIEIDPVYIILNLCRVLAFIRTGSVLSKAQGGEWGIRNLDSEFHPLIEAAVEAYSTDKIMEADPHAARRFCRYMISRINSEQS